MIVIYYSGFLWVEQKTLRAVAQKTLRSVTGQKHIEPKSGDIIDE